MPREAILSRVRQLDRCPRHLFPAADAGTAHKATCLACGGTLDLTAIRFYIRGYMAAGGNSEEIWPGFFEVKSHV